VKATIQYVDIPRGKRVLAASDLHGHGSRLARLLRKAGFCEDDMLFLVGDCLERGRENLKTLRMVMELCRLPNVFATVGNVDLWALTYFTQSAEDIKARIDLFVKHHGSTLFTELCEEAGLPYDTLAQIAYARDRLPLLYRDEIEFIRSLPTIIETPFYRFVHGGLPTKNLDELDMSNPLHYLKNDAFIDQGVSFDKWLIVGHWPASLYHRDRIDLNPYVSISQRIIDIDGGSGVKSDGQVNLLVFPHAGEDSFTSLCTDDFPRFRALDPQQESETSGNINYADPWVEILEVRDSLTRVRRISDGYEMWTVKPVKTEDGKSRLWGDSTDYRHQIFPGDVISLIARDAVGCYIKKDGVCGYYNGRIEPLV